jgi:hypothetical protein
MPGQCPATDQQNPFFQPGLCRVFPNSAAISSIRRGPRRGAFPLLPSGGSRGGGGHGLYEHGGPPVRDRQPHGVSQLLDDGGPLSRGARQPGDGAVRLCVKDVKP